MRLGVNLGYGVDLSAETTHVRDTGRPLVSENTTSMIKAKWRRRKLQATFDLRRERDAQGDFERTRTYAQFIVRRDF